MLVFLALLIVFMLGFAVGNRYGISKAVKDLFKSVENPVVMRGNYSLYEQVARLKKRTGSSEKGVVIGALNLLQWALDEQGKGNKIVSVSDKENNHDQWSVNDG